jgi:hypothetical protein
MCNHVSKVLKWGVDDKADLVATLYGCTNCSATSVIPFDHLEDDAHQHTEYVEGCFACKVQTLQLGTGDAKGALVESGWTQKKWKTEINEYRKARAQGIQPTGTSLSKVRAAVEKSNQTGVAFGSKG